MEYRTDWNFNVMRRNGGWVMIRGATGMPHCSSNPEAYRAASRIAAINAARGSRE
jgi:hypothetical protein